MEQWFFWAVQFPGIPPAEICRKTSHPKFMGSWNSPGKGLIKARETMNLPFFHGTTSLVSLAHLS